MSSRLKAQAAHLGAIAGIAQLDINPLVRVLPLVEPFLSQPLVVGMRADGTELALVAPIPAVDVLPWIAPLDSAIAGTGRPLSQAVGASATTGHRELELRTASGGCAVAVRLFGDTREHGDTLVALGIPDVTVRVIRDGLKELPPAPTALVVRVIAGTVEVELGRILDAVAAAKAIDALAYVATVTAAQRGLIAQVHGLLARSQPCAVSLVVSPRGLVPRLVIRYAPMPWDTALRFATGLYRGDTATRLGRFAGAVGGEQVESLEVVLGPTEPPESWIAAAQRIPTNHLA